jgi:hypothetical protein
MAAMATTARFRRWCFSHSRFSLGAFLAEKEKWRWSWRGERARVLPAPGVLRMLGGKHQRDGRRSCGEGGGRTRRRRRTGAPLHTLELGWAKERLPWLGCCVSWVRLARLGLVSCFYFLLLSNLFLKFGEEKYLDI